MKKLKVIEKIMEKTAPYLEVFQLQKYARPYLTLILFLMFLNIIVSILGMINPLLTKMIIDQAYAHKDWQLFYKIFAAYLAIFIFTLGLSLVISYLQTYLTEKMNFRMKLDMQKSCSKASYRFFERRSPGEHVFRFNSDTGTVVDFYINTLPNILIIVSQIVFFIIISIKLSPAVTLLYFGIIPFRLVLELIKANKIKPLQHKMQEIGQEISNFFSQYRLGILTTKIFGKEKFEERRMVSVCSDRIRLVFKAWRLDTFYETLKTFFGGTWEALVMFYGWYLAIRGDLSIGTLVALQQYLSKLGNPISSIIHIFSVLVQNAVATERIKETLFAEPEEAAKPSYEPLPQSFESLEFRKVDFGYLPEQIVLHDINFKIKPGMVIGITGPSGVGKTTLTNLLMRIYEKKSGAILLGNTDTSQISIRELRKAISIVQQEIFFFQGAIRDNILYGNSQVSEADMIRAAEAAMAHDFIMAMPNGYDTVLGGKEGINLSAGQRQRLGLARALVKQAPILVLDEFTASLDAEVETQVIQNLKKWFANKIIFIVSHKVTHLINTDYVLVLYQGTIAQSGKPNELLHQEGLFQKLYNIQYRIMDLNIDQEYNELEKELVK